MMNKVERKNTKPKPEVKLNSGNRIQGRYSFIFKLVLYKDANIEDGYTAQYKT